MPIYAATVFLSAFLLFLVQPLIAKLILPWFGGSAAVWNTCMLFFQILLLAGYAYAHWSIQRLTPVFQFRLHSVLLLLAVFTPSLPPEWLKPAGDQAPVLPILLVLAVTIGLPYFLLSSTSPLLQAWYARIHSQSIPYRLFALSNAASLLALLAYPIAIEPYLPARFQAYGWHVAFGVFAFFCIYTAWRSSTAEVVKSVESEASDVPPPPTGQDYLTWIALAACPTMLFLSFTSHLVQNIASIPFLWVVPLSMYLLSFILTFDSDRLYKPEIFRILTPLALVALLYGLYKSDSDTDLRYSISAAAVSLLLFCTFCHGELALRKPHPRYLTNFFLMLSVGGAIGGFLISIVAPLVLTGYFEIHIALFLFAITALSILLGQNRLGEVAWTAASVCAVALAWQAYRAEATGSRIMVRNFYGAMRVVDSEEGPKTSHTRTLIHGVINHGRQYLDDSLFLSPITYFSPNSGVGLAIVNSWHMNHRVGIIGLGTGTLTAYSRPGDYYRVYEINPLVLDVARTQFRFLSGCRGTCENALGDARLSLEKEKPQNFDVLVVDAFSGDSIPVHLLTKESFELYRRHLTPDGILAVHVSNKHLALAPVVERLATSMGLTTLLVSNDESETEEVFAADWVLVAKPMNPTLSLPIVQSAGAPVPPRPELRVWTDDYSNLFQIWK
jgi:hypothetical protein